MGGIKDHETLRLIVLGQSSQPIKELLLDTRDRVLSKQTPRTTVRRPSPKEHRGRGRQAWSRVAVRPTRPMGTVVLDSQQQAAILRDINDFLDPATCRWYSNQGQLLKIHAQLVLGCTMFATYTSSLSRSLQAVDPDLANPTSNISAPSKPGPPQHQQQRQTSASSTTDPDLARLSRMFDTLKKYEHHFNRHLRILRTAGFEVPGSMPAVSHALFLLQPSTALALPPIV
jgi:BCS1 N terminal